MATVEDISKIPLDNCTIQYKIDGDFQVIQFDRLFGKAEAININGTVRTDFPALEEFYECLIPISKVKSATILAELYAIDDGKICKLNKYRHILHSDTSKIHIGLHTIESLNGKDFNGNSFEVLGEWFNMGNRVKIIPYIIPKSREEIEEFYNKGIPQGYEGIVIRRFNSIWKLKPLLDVDAVIIGFNKRSLWKEGYATSLKLALMDKKNRFIEIGHCASGINRKLGKRLYDYSKLSYITENAETVFVKPELIIEIQTERPYSTDKAKVWEYSPKYGWVSTEDVPGYHVRSARLIRFRDDKEVNNVDLRLEQMEL